MRYRALFLLVALSVPTPAPAQSADAVTLLAAGAGVMTADLPHAGTAPVFSVRAARRLPWNLAIEGGVAHATLDRQFGRFPLTAFEVQLQYHVPAGRFTPYFGAGAGLVRDGSEVPGGHWFPLTFEGWDPSISFAGGTRVRLNDRAGVFGEVRLRGVDWTFRGKTTDFIGGIVIGFR